MMNFSAPLSLIVSAGADQLVVLRSEFCCKLQPVEGEGQLTTAVLVVVSEMESFGTTLTTRNTTSLK